MTLLDSFFETNPPYATKFGDTKEVVTEWERNDLAQAIYAASVARVAMREGVSSLQAHDAFLRALAATAKHAAAVYFETLGDDKAEA
jgi:hypothetical protein